MYSVISIQTGKNGIAKVQISHFMVVRVYFRTKKTKWEMDSLCGSEHVLKDWSDRRVI